MPKRTLIGVVKSAKCDKTISVLVTSRKKHKRYHKIINTSKIFVAHDEENTATEGDKVTIEESRPISRTKKWTLLNILQKAI
jgi:small subunit ribosomal protein S17